MLLMIRSSAVCLLNTISTALNSSSSSNTQEGLPGLATNGTGHDSPSGRRMHKVGLEREIQVAMNQNNREEPGQ
jgi:hypothetical protein